MLRIIFKLINTRDGFIYAKDQQIIVWFIFKRYDIY